MPEVVPLRPRDRAGRRPATPRPWPRRDLGSYPGEGLDHTFPKATGDNYELALDGDKLRFLMQADNTKLSHLEKKDPSLRRQGDDDDAAP